MLLFTSNLLDTFDCTIQTKMMLLLSSSILWITLQENFVVLCTVIAKLKTINTVKGMLYSSSICLFNDLRTAAWTETTHLHFLWTSAFAGGADMVLLIPSCVKPRLSFAIRSGCQSRCWCWNWCQWCQNNSSRATWFLPKAGCATSIGTQSHGVQVCIVLFGENQLTGIPVMINIIHTIHFGKW